MYQNLLKTPDYNSWVVCESNHSNSDKESALVHEPQNYGPPFGSLSIVSLVHALANFVDWIDVQKKKDKKILFDQLNDLESFFMSQFCVDSQLLNVLEHC